jgi:hypothetical protein
MYLQGFLPWGLGRSGGMGTALRLVRAHADECAAACVVVRSWLIPMS